MSRYETFGEPGVGVDPEPVVLPTQDRPRMANEWYPSTRDLIEQALSRAAVAVGLRISDLVWNELLVTAAREIESSIGTRATATPGADGAGGCKGMAKY